VSPSQCLNRWVLSTSKPRVPTLLVYAVALSGLAFVLRDLMDLLILAIPPLILSIVLIRGRLKWLMLAYSIGLMGVFVNALFFSNTGPTVVSIGLLEIREKALESFTIVSLRLLAIATSGALFALLYSPVEIYRGLLYEIGAPVTIALPIAFALRLMPVIRRDFEEVIFQRKQRKYRTILLNPVHFSSVVGALFTINYERAKWSGISAEIRGLRRIKPTRNYRVGLTDVFMLMILLSQIVLIIAT